MFNVFHARLLAEDQNQKARTTHWYQRQKQPPKMFYIKKGVLRNFAKFKGKHLCQILFFDKVAGLRPDRVNQN